MDTLAVSKCLGEKFRNVEEIAISVLDPIDTPIVDNVQESPLFTEALNSNFHSPQEAAAKKILAAALVVASKKGLLPKQIPAISDGIEAASLSDESVLIMKTAHQTATGNISATEALDILIDNTTARTIAISKKIVEKGVDFAVDKISTTIATAFPYAAPIAFALKTFKPFITTKAQTIVEKGINKLNIVAKKALRSAHNIVKEKISNKVRSLIFN
ncbi:MAG: hypothetical protein K2G07_04395 [Muribaculaceae bacterium]|nr:hypothetical protein [Muribaculaceae bacterium]